MKLLLRRSHRPGLLDGRPVYTIDVKGQFREDELTGVYEYRLGGTLLYGRMEVAERGRGLLGFAFSFSFRAANLTIHVRDLINGKRVEFVDVSEALAFEDQVKASARRFSQVLAAAVHFDGDEALDL